ncbi:MAG: hypothetical protein KDK23_17615 [Leptospiraceae bacterium]|nr:hypothetical protein [Leptospiraceae bacterium]MCB1167207.1 hypothetical protein [Leptospiraceae bacterium]MCB1305423.1 hypothetical protein [Leptospiraceae bacterium]
MIVRKLETPLYQKRKREPLAGQGVEHAAAANAEKSFDQYLLEAFQGEVVRKDDSFQGKLSDLQRDNIIRLSQI